MANLNLDKILSAESPMQWDPLFLDENIHEIDLEVIPTGQFSFMNFVDKLIRCYNAYDNKNVTKALEIIENLETCISELDKSHADPFLDKIQDAVYHVVYTTKATLFLNQGDHESCLKIFKHVKNFNDFSDINKAAIYAIRSACLALYSYDGTRVSIDYINIAISKDPECTYWAFLKGFYLFKLRKIQNPDDTPSLEEREIFEKINKEEKDQPLFMVHLADVFRETAVNSNKKKELFFWFMPEESAKVDLKNKIDSMCENAKAYYEKSYKLRPACPFVAFRCASGLMKLPTRYQNVQLAKNILIDMAPKYKDSGFANLVNAFYHEMYAKDMNMAKQHLEIAVKLNVFNAHINRISKNHFSKEKNFDAVKELEEMLEKFKELPKKMIILSQLISYYIFVKLDLKLVCDYTIQYFHKKGQSNCLERHHSCFIRTKEPISLIDVVTDEVKLAMVNKKITPELLTTLTTFVHKMSFAGIVLKGNPQNLRTRIMQGKGPNTSPWYPNPAQNNNPRNFQPRAQHNQNIRGGHGVPAFQGPRQQYQNRQGPCKERSVAVKKPPEKFQQNFKEKKERPVDIEKPVEKNQKNNYPEKRDGSMNAKKPFEKDHKNSQQNADSMKTEKTYSKDMEKREGSVKNEPHRRRLSTTPEEDRYQKRSDAEGSRGKENRRRESPRRKYDSYYDDRHRRHSSRDEYRRHKARSNFSSSDSADYEKRRRSVDRRSHGRRRHDSRRRRHHSYDSESDSSQYSSRARYYSPLPRRRHRRTSSSEYDKSHHKRYERVRKRSPKYKRRSSVSSISSERSMSKESYKRKDEDSKKRDKRRSDSYEYDKLLARRIRSMKVDEDERQNAAEIRGNLDEEKDASRSEKKSRKVDHLDRGKENRNDHTKGEEKPGVTGADQELRRTKKGNGKPSSSGNESEHVTSDAEKRREKRK